MHVILTIYAHVLLINCKLSIHLYIYTTPWDIYYIYMYIYICISIEIVYTMYTNHTTHHSYIKVGNTRPIPAEQNL